MTRIRVSSISAVTLEGNNPSAEMVAGEVQEFIYDPSLDLGEEQAPTNPGYALIDTATGTTVSGGATPDTPPVEDGRLFIRVTGVERGATYELRIGFNHTPPRVAGERTVRLFYIKGK